MIDGEYRILEIDKKVREATISSASWEEIKAGDYPEWTYQRRGRYDTKQVDDELKRRAKKRGYKIISED